METVTVRMARGDRNTPWGFGVTEAPSSDVVIVNVVGGSLADRAGLRNGDILDELEGLRNLDINATDRLLVTSRDKIELVVHRNGSGGGVARVWKPEITKDLDSNFRVNLEHNGSSVPPKGFNSSALPFNTDPRVKHLQYNSPLGIYSNSSAAEQYAQQTAGVVHADPSVDRARSDQPAYLRSETLRVLKEQEGGYGAHPNPQGLPVCYVCTRPILGVMASAAGHPLHGDCLACSTCGSSLKNVGHHFIDGKFYCDVHARLKRATSTGHEHSVRSTVPAPINSSQQLDMSRRPLSVSPNPSQWASQTNTLNVTATTPRTQGTISPSARGVPASHSYGADLRTTRAASSIPAPSAPAAAPYRPMSTLAAPAPAPPPPSNPPPVSTQQSQMRSSFNDSRRSGALQEQPVGGKVPYCEACRQQIRGAFVLAQGLSWCPEHFICANQSCARRLLECGFVEENGQKYCETCFENNIAPRCAKCSRPIVSDCLNALQKKWHPQCFTCAHCSKPFGNSAFYLEQGLPYCEADWNRLFTTKCYQCTYPIEAGDRWVEALGHAYHSNCFNCTRCNINLEGESFYAKNGEPFCKMHA